MARRGFRAGGWKRAELARAGVVQVPPVPIISWGAGARGGQKEKEKIPFLNSTKYSIEEISAKILAETGLKRRKY